MSLLIQYTIMYASVLFLVALGGCFSERSGVINLGLEGIMVMGALGGALVMKFCVGMPAVIMVLLVIAGSVLLGVLFSLFLAVAAINFKADQTLVGTAMNMLGVAAATVFVKSINAAENSKNISSVIKYIDQKKMLILTFGKFQLSLFTIIAILALILSVFVLYRTQFGLRLMACGENPHAADSVGIDVKKMRYAGVMISGALGALGGIAYITVGVSEWRFEYGVAGYGFLALAVMIFGAWKPVRIAYAALLFGFLRALGSVYSGIDFLNALHIPTSIYNMLPYIISLIVLIFASKYSRAPKAEGIPYDK